jgi:toxin secretion/phage lysis holin
MKTTLIICAICAGFMVFDIITGLLQAIENKTYKSSKMRVGLWHKISFVLIIALAFGLEFAQGFIDLGFTIPLVIPVCAYICMNEIGSIIENIALLNPKLVPAKLRELLNIKFDIDKDDETKEG